MCNRPSTARREIVRIASRRTRSFGAANLTALVSSAGVKGIETSEQQVREAVNSEAQFLDDDWFFLPGDDRNRLYSLSLRMLAVAAPLDVPTIRAGACRTYRHRGSVLVPPLDVMTAYYRSHPAFTVDAQCRVRPSSDLDYRVELSACDRIFVEVFRSSWVGVLDRDSFHEACVARGMTRRTFEVRATYSAILDQAPGEIWFLRGTRISPITAAALRHAKSAGVAFNEGQV